MKLNIVTDIFNFYYMEYSYFSNLIFLMNYVNN